MSSTDSTIHFETPVITIGKYEWRLVVYTDVFYGKCTAHHFRAIGTPHWEDYHDWPTYDFNDVEFGGLPPRLAGKYWTDNKDAILGALQS